MRLRSLWRPWRVKDQERALHERLRLLWVANDPIPAEIYRDEYPDLLKASRTLKTGVEMNRHTGLQFVDVYQSSFGPIRIKDRNPDPKIRALDTILNA